MGNQFNDEKIEVSKVDLQNILAQNQKRKELLSSVVNAVESFMGSAGDLSNASQATIMMKIPKFISIFNTNKDLQKVFSIEFLTELKKYSE